MRAMVAQPQAAARAAPSAICAQILRTLWVKGSRLARALGTLERNRYDRALIPRHQPEPGLVWKTPAGVCHPGGAGRTAQGIPASHGRRDRYVTGTARKDPVRPYSRQPVESRKCRLENSLLGAARPRATFC